MNRHIALAPDPIVVRQASPNDQRALVRLAALDSSEQLAGDALIGELASGPVAALSLRDGRVVADPFVPTGQVVQLLRLRAYQIDVPRGARRALRKLVGRR